MKIAQILKLIDGKVIFESVNDSDAVIEYAFCSDLMSDVLALVNKANNIILLTGLCNIQSIRTCEMMDIKHICFIRKKIPSDEMIELAKQNGINLYTCPLTMYETCGILYSNKLESISI